MSAIEVKGARRLYGRKAAVDGASLTVQAGRLTCQGEQMRIAVTGARRLAGRVT